MYHVVCVFHRVRIPRDSGDRITGNWEHLVAAALACDSAESGVDLGSKSLMLIAIGVEGWGCFWRPSWKLTSPVKGILSR